ncbi:response regulator [Hamadaea tsunoensis]|uniref:response regulator n=1 Tax=Hamadaea tsunoensis TaxID=53368 RepID=UPI0003FDB481|nr:response regulator transcription factor [Hamadaea tsunoensis]
MIKVLIVDDQALIRAGFRALLAEEDDIEVVAEGTHGGEAVELAVAYRPDVVLLDIQMPGLDGIEATRLISGDERLAGVHVVILTNYGLDEYVYDALRAGAAGFLVKDTDPADLLHGIRVAARGDALLSPAITRRLIGEFVARRPRGAVADALGVLTHREREVVALAARGLSNEEIAETAVISLATAKTHISRAMTKLHARDRAQLVVFAYESGLVLPPDRT